MRTTLPTVLSQVDRLFLVLNEYKEVPNWLSVEPKIEAVCPSEDLKDAGKFYFQPRPDDIVFLVDDDIIYPPDYVSTTVSQISRLGMEDRCFGYFGNALFPKGKVGVSWKTHMFDKALGRIRGACVLGTGTAIAKGDLIPPLEYMKDYIGICDLGFANWQLTRGNLPWLLKRSSGWITDSLTEDLAATSLYETVHRKNSQRQRRLLRKFAEGFPHADVPYRQYYLRQRAAFEAC